MPWILRMRQRKSGKRGQSLLEFQVYVEDTESWRRLSEAGITHIFVQWGEIRRYRDSYGFTDFITPELFDELAGQGLLEKVELEYPRDFGELFTVSGGP